MFLSLMMSEKMTATSAVATVSSAITSITTKQALASSLQFLIHGTFVLV